MKYGQLPKSRRQALNLYVKLMRATNRATNAIHRHLQEDNLTHSQFAVLEALYHLGPLCQGELGEKILKSNANLTTVVDSLEKKSAGHARSLGAGSAAGHGDPDVERGSTDCRGFPAARRNCRT